MKRKYFCAGAAVLLMSTTALAEERVTLTDGTVMQGDLVEKVPGKHITIKLATGEVRTIQWESVAQQGSEQTTHVVVESDTQNTQLVRITSFGSVSVSGVHASASGSYENVEPVCVAPCEANIGNGVYRISGSPTESSSFGVPSSPTGSTTLHVRGGSRGLQIVGALLISIGGGGIIGGGATAGTFALLNGMGTNVGFDTNPWIVGGLITAGIGLAMVALGVPLLIASATHVHTDGGVVVARKPGVGFVF